MVEWGLWEWGLWEWGLWGGGGVREKKMGRLQVFCQADTGAEM